jgi:hypothetical protein
MSYTSPEPRDLVPLPPPGPGLTRLRRRLADRTAFRDALLAALAETPEPDGSPLGGRLDVAGDPTVLTVAELWSRVADSVAAYTELAAGERYLGTAQDWTDLRRTADLLGYHPAQRAAAHGWVRCTTDTGTSPSVPAGTRVQAPGTATRAAQTYEVATTTALRADWAELVVTGVPVPQVPPGSALRFLADPGFAPPDRVLFVAERPAVYTPPPADWWSWLIWIFAQYVGGTATRSVVGTATVRKRADDLGAFLITMDRPLGPMLPSAPGTTYAAYRVRASLELARRIDKISFIDAGVAKTVPAPYDASEPAAVSASRLLVVDAGAASPGLGVIVANGNGALVTTIDSVDSVDWSVAPGTRHRVGSITLHDPLPPGLQASDITITLVDAGVVAQHYELPTLLAGQNRLRVHPRPSVVPARVSVRTTAGWELANCSIAADDTPSDAGGMLLAVTSGFAGAATAAPATANLVPIQHGTTSTSPLTLSAGTTIVPGPVTGDVDATGQVTDSLVVRVDGQRFDEVPSLYGRGANEPVYASKLAADGRLVLSFGDGVHGALPRGAVTGSWRTGGGLEGELDGALINTVLGSVPGVRTMQGVALTTGAADQEDPLRMRRAAAASIRAFDRAVSLDDLADLALTVPGTSHTASWRGAGPPGCPCGGTGLHVAALRLSAGGVRAPVATELISLAGYLDARRDTTVPMCVCAGLSTPLLVTASVAVDPRREPGVVCAAVVAALTDPLGPLAPRPRELGLPMDASDIVRVAQPVLGVVGIATLTVAGAVTAASAGDALIGRTLAARYELLSVGSATVTAP